jgi:hypothetical protein
MDVPAGSTRALDISARHMAAGKFFLVHDPKTYRPFFSLSTENRSRRTFW